MQSKLWKRIMVALILVEQLLGTMGMLRVAKKLIVTKGKSAFHFQCPLLERNQEQKPLKSDELDFDTVVWFVLGENTVIGSTVQYDRKKYSYDPSSGELAILNVAYEDAGLYRCEVKYADIGSRIGMMRPDSSTVQLLVHQPYENIWEEEYKDNLVRAVISASITLGLLTSLCALHKYRWREPKYVRHQLDEMETGNGLRNLNLELEGRGMEKFLKKQNFGQHEENSFGGSETSGCDSSPLRKSPLLPPPSKLAPNSDKSVPASVHVTNI